MYSKKREKFEDAWWEYSRGYSLLPNTQLHEREIYKSVDINGTVLDIGCGDQGCTLEKEQEDAFLVGLDVSRAALEHAKRMNKDANVVCGDAEHLPFVDNSFDKVLSIGTTVYADDVLESLKEARRVSKKDVVLTFSHKDDTEAFSAERGYVVFDENEVNKTLEDAGLKINKFKIYARRGLGIRSQVLPDETKSVMYVECEK